MTYVSRKDFDALTAQIEELRAARDKVKERHRAELAPINRQIQAFLARRASWKQRLRPSRAKIVTDARTEEQRKRDRVQVEQVVASLERKKLI